MIATPDHWHSKISIDAMLSGRDVYCEKPLTLTIDEGKLICDVVKRTGRVFQVGTQQRTEFGQRFIQAIAMIRDGRLGKLRKVVASTGGGEFLREHRISSATHLGCLQPPSGSFGPAFGESVSATELKRKLTWDLATEEIVGDVEAKSHQSRKQREGYEVTA